jgi:hypothetical protein
MKEAEAIIQMRRENNLFCGVRCLQHPFCITGKMEHLDTSEGNF